MSRRALLTAVRDELRQALGFSAAECEVTDMTGRPPPTCGKRFVGVHRGARRGDGQGATLDETVDVLVTVTVRVNVGRDKIGTNVLEAAETGVDDLCDAIRLAVNKDRLDNRVCNRANQVIGQTPTDAAPGGFLEGLFFADDNNCRLVGGDWFGADPEAADVGVAQTVRFTGARFLRPLTQE